MLFVSSRSGACCAGAAAVRPASVLGPWPAACVGRTTTRTPIGSLTSQRDDVLNMRSGPSIGYPVVGRIPPGGRGVRLVGPCREWCPVSYNGASGWVNPLYLAAEPAVAPLVELENPDEPAVLPRASGYIAVEPPVGRKRARLPSYWQVTGVAEGESLKVHDGPSLRRRSCTRSSRRPGA